MMLPGVLVLATMGAYGLANSLFDVYVLMTVGVIAYSLAKVRVPLVTMALGLVLGRRIEQTYQQSSIVAGAHKETMFRFFLSRPVNIVLMLICALVVFSGIRQILRERAPRESLLPPPWPRQAQGSRVAGSACGSQTSSSACLCCCSPEPASGKYGGCRSAAASSRYSYPPSSWCSGRCS
jgi:hypothetical protein